MNTNTDIHLKSQEPGEHPIQADVRVDYIEKTGRSYLTLEVIQKGHGSHEISFYGSEEQIITIQEALRTA